MTSFDTLAVARRIIKQRKVGHCGTLDMFATGLLILCTGASTRLTRYFLEKDKVYEATIQLGIRTDTDDLTGNVIEQKPFSQVTKSALTEVIDKFKGEQMQLPPLYSALKINGRRASDLVRKGGDVDLKPRRVFIKDILLQNYDSALGKVDLIITCSKGTYIRSLARDIGEMLGTGAHCSALRRLSSGTFSIENAITVDELQAIADGKESTKGFCLSPIEALSGFNRAIIKEEALKKALNGAAFREDEVKSLEHVKGNEFIILSEDENLIAIANIDIDKWQIKYLNVFSSTYAN